VRRAIMPEDTDTRSDAELLDLLREGDTAALDGIARRHREAALRVARSLVDHHSAEDVVSEAFERLWAAIRHGGGPVDVVRSYLIRVVRSCAVDLYRRKRDIPVDPDTQSPGQTEDPSDSVADAMLVQRALDGLPERWKAVLWLYYVDDVSRAEIAAQLGILPTAVSQLLSRARAGFRKAYLDQAASVAAAGCTETRGLLPDYVDGRAKPVQRSRVEGHLDGCESCESVASRLADFSRNVGAVVAVAMVGGVGISLVRRPELAQASMRPRTSGQGTKVAIAAGAVAAVGALAAILVLHDQPGRPDEGVALPAPVEITRAAPTRTPSTASTSPLPTPAASTPAASTPTASTPAASTPAASTPAASVRVTTSASVPPPKPSATATATATATPAVPDLELGTPTALLRSSQNLRVHLSVPAVVPTPGVARLDLEFTRPVIFRTHHDSAYSAWDCVATDAARSTTSLQCSLTPESALTLLGLDLDYAGTQSVTITVRSEPPGQSSARVRTTVELPTLG